MLGLMATSDIAPATTALPRECHFDIGICSQAGEYGENEDYCAATEAGESRQMALALADGIGSESYGRTISRIACLASLAKLTQGEDVERAFGAGLKEIRTFLRAAQSPRSGASLLVAACQDDRLKLACVGDCRAALIRDATLVWLNSLDRVPGTNRLASAASADMVTRPHIIEQEIGKDDMVVFMTDGTYETLDEREIASIVHDAPSASAAAEALVRRGRRVGRDDATAAVVRLPQY